MATWKVQQKVEMWREISIEAESMEKALFLAEEISSTTWKLLTNDFVECEEFWIESDTGKSWTVDHTGTHEN